MKNERITKIGIVLSALVLSILAFGKYLMYLQWNIDDAHIVYRIVNNILNGHGWVYNIGEAHNVSTSVSNTVLITLLSYLTEDICLAAHIIGGLAIFGAGLIVYWLFRQHFNNSIALLMGYMLIREMGSNGTWGLEANLFICFILFFVLLEEYRKDSWPLLGIMVLTRPDGMLLIGLKWLKEFITQRSYSVNGILKVLFILAPWAIFSLYQFHQVFPDTFSQKVWQGRSGFWGRFPFVYLYDVIDHYFLSSSLLLKGLVGLAGIGLLLMLRDRSPFLYITFYGLIQKTAYAILNVPVYPWYLALPDVTIHIAALYTLGTLFSMLQKRYAPRATSLNAGFFRFSAQFSKVLSLSVPLILLIPALLALKSGYENPQVDRRDVSYTRIIKSFDTLYGPGRLATLEVGSIGFYTDRTIVDIAGLTSTTGEFVTKERMDIFYSDPPELLLLHDPIWKYEASIYNDYRFPLVYEDGMNFPDPYFPMQLYVRRDDCVEVHP